MPLPERDKDWNRQPADEVHDPYLLRMLALMDKDDGSTNETKRDGNERERS